MVASRSESSWQSNKNQIIFFCYKLIICLRSACVRLFNRFGSTRVCRSILCRASRPNAAKYWARPKVNGKRFKWINFGNKYSIWVWGQTGHRPITEIDHEFHDPKPNRAQSKFYRNVTDRGNFEQTASAQQKIFNENIYLGHSIGRHNNIHKIWQMCYFDTENDRS